MVTVRLPTVLRELVGGAATVEVAAGSVRDVLKGLAETHPAFGRRIFDDAGKVRRFVNVFVDDEDIRFANGLETTVTDGQTLSLLPAVAGGGAG
jgi:molybdopterin synthase sulfur carrier subunit